MAGQRLVKNQFAGISEDDISCRPTSLSTLSPRDEARFVVSKAFLPFLTDQQLLYEAKRRTAADRANKQP
jgi:hypothetical protein